MTQKHRISIYASDRQCYSLGEFKKKENIDKIGIAVQTEDIGLIVAFEQWYLPYGFARPIELKPGWKMLYDPDCGWEQTELDYEYQCACEDTRDTAVIRCREYGLGGLPWYVPSKHELTAIIKFLPEINDVRKQLGVALIDGKNYFWSSNFRSGLYQFAIRFDSPMSLNKNRFYNQWVLPVSSYYSLKWLSKDSPAVCNYTEEAAMHYLHEQGYHGTLTKESNITITI